MHVIVTIIDMYGVKNSVKNVKFVLTVRGVAKEKTRASIIIIEIT